MGIWHVWHYDLPLIIAGLWVGEPDAAGVAGWKQYKTRKGKAGGGDVVAIHLPTEPHKHWLQTNKAWDDCELTIFIARE